MEENKIYNKSRSNRLNLNFNLTYIDERRDFVEEYLNRPQFEANPPTASELETIANYILWGKNRSTDKNIVQEGSIQIATRAKLWDANAAKVESLDNLLTQPGFTEQQILSAEAPRYKYPKETFSRSSARRTASPEALAILEQLWKEIDSLDLELNYYDLIHGKRVKPPREELLTLFSNEEQQTLKEQAAHLNQFQYLKKRHLLVELRREQYTIKDLYRPIRSLHSAPSTQLPQTISTIETDYPVAPVGLIGGVGIQEKLFPKDRYPIPSDFTQEELKSVLQFYWARAIQTNVYDFRNPDHVGKTFEQFQQLNSERNDDILSNSNSFLDTLQFYIARADLSDTQREILDLKLRKVSNPDIAQYINKKYDKSYTINYISTIFRQKIIPQICAAAQIHAEIIENLTFPENFKKCKTCGRILLISPINFVKKSRSPDGYSTQCKICDREARIKSKDKIKKLD